jgi:hypothetical protein
MPPLRFDSGYHWDDPRFHFDGDEPEPYHVMPNDNRISATISPADKTAFDQKLAEATALLPFLVNLTPEEKRRLVTIGLERAAMVDAFLQEMANHPELVPSYVDMVEVNKDAGTYRCLIETRQRPAELVEKHDDTIMLVGGDLMTAFGSFYASVKDARRRNVPGSDTSYNRLRPYFDRSPRQPAAPTP